MRSVGTPFWEAVRYYARQIRQGDERERVFSNDIELWGARFAGAVHEQVILEVDAVVGGAAGRQAGRAGEAPRAEPTNHSTSGMRGRALDEHSTWRHLTFTYIGRHVAMCRGAQRCLTLGNARAYRHWWKPTVL